MSRANYSLKLILIVFLMLGTVHCSGMTGLAADSAAAEAIENIDFSPAGGIDTSVTSDVDGDADIDGDANNNAEDDQEYVEGDTDGDGLIDAEDNCEEIENADQTDTDGDSYGDACDAFPENPDEWVDTDEDGLGDNEDLCAEDADAEQIDADGDLYGDDCDAFPENPDEWADDDNDGYGDNTEDNCPEINNGDQEDIDGDGTGDACDPDDNNDYDDDGDDSEGDDSDEGDGDIDDVDDNDDGEGDGDGDDDDGVVEVDPETLPDEDAVDPENVIDERDFNTRGFVPDHKIDITDTLKTPEELLAGTGIDARNPLESTNEWIDKFREWGSPGPFLPDPTDEEDGIYTGATDFLKNEWIDRLGQATDQVNTRDYLEEMRPHTDFFNQVTDQLIEEKPVVERYTDVTVKPVTDFMENTYQVKETIPQIDLQQNILTNVGASSTQIQKAETNLVNTQIVTQPVVSVQSVETTAVQNLEVKTLSTTNLKTYTNIRYSR